MPLRTVIPSHRRHDRVLSKRLLPDPIICVAESQADLYRTYNPECEIVTHPDTVVGLIPKRNWMARHFGNVFMVDDDVTLVKNLVAEPGDPQSIRDPEKVWGIISSLHEMACMTGVHLYGFTSRTTPMMYEEREFLSFSKMITGCSYGVRWCKDVWWHEDLRLKEDFWISCWMKYCERRVLTDLRYSFQQKDTFVNPGGLSAIRSQEEELKSILFIRKHFGESVKLKGKTGNGQSATRQKVKHNISCEFRF